MAIAVTEVYEFTNGITRHYSTTPELAIMASFDVENAAQTYTGEGTIYANCGFHIDDQTKISKLWGIYVDGDLYRLTATKDEATKASQNLTKAIEQIKKLGDCESISFSPLFNIEPSPDVVSSGIARIKL